MTKCKSFCHSPFFVVIIFVLWYTKEKVAKQNNKKGMKSMKTITQSNITDFKTFLNSEEKSKATVEKYVHDVKLFSEWIKDREVTKQGVLEYKNILIGSYSPKSVNVIISALNSFFKYKGWYDCCVKALKIQKQIFISQEKELTKKEYESLLKAAQNNRRLYLLMQTICSSGIRVSELRYVTVEAVKKRQAQINSKGKMRIVILPQKLCEMLMDYARTKKIMQGSIFVTKSGKPLDRSNIWSDMKRLCKIANVNPKKVFPHNLRHLFARTYYSVQKDIVRLSDILGHSRIDTTRIYTMETGEVHRQQIQRLGLLLC